MKVKYDLIRSSLLRYIKNVNKRVEKLEDKEMIAKLTLQRDLVGYQKDKLMNLAHELYGDNTRDKDLDVSALKEAGIRIDVLSIVLKIDLKEARNSLVRAIKNGHLNQIRKSKSRIKHFTAMINALQGESE